MTGVFLGFWVGLGVMKGKEKAAYEALFGTVLRLRRCRQAEVVNNI